MKNLLVVAMTAGAAVALSPMAAAEPSWTMPNLIGMNLQGAQDAIQSLTRGAVWFSGSTDLTGKGRAQIIDRNWQVCTSTPAAGTTITTSTAVRFGVVRDTEKCP
jgi:hypothetical protein